MIASDNGAKPKFAHPSEAEFAQILDFYQIRWEYEAHNFTLTEDDSGKAIEAFSPDFYLPDFDLYIELTTAKQKLIAYKRRKVRLLQERHPEINIKLITRDDFLRMIDKYGLDDEESGLVGSDAHGR
jgi:hypothetical protein